MPQPSNSPIEANEIGKGEILDLLNDESTNESVESTENIETEPQAEEEAEEKEGKKKEEVKLVGDEEQEEEPSYDEDKIDIIAPARRQEILKKYPNLFKEFPHLERSYYRDQKYNELFGTPEDAEQVVERAKNFDNFSETLLQGNTETVLKAVKEQNPDAFGRIVDGYLNTLRQVDDKAFFHVVQNTIKSTVAAMVQEANRSQNEDLLGAARLLHQFVMGTTEWREPEPYAKQRPRVEQQQETQLNQERMEFFRERFETVQSDLQSRVDGVLKNTIDQNMDPKGSMTNYVKRIAVTEAMENVQQQISTDTQFRRLLDRLWEKAATDKFSKTSTEKIRSAYLAKAKTLLPAAIKKSRIEALRGLGKRVREEDVDIFTNGNRNKSRESAAPQTLRGSSKENASKGKSTLDFLNED